MKHVSFPWERHQTFMLSGASVAQFSIYFVAEIAEQFVHVGCKSWFVQESRGHLLCEADARRDLDI